MGKIKLSNWAIVVVLVSLAYNSSDLINSFFKKQSVEDNLLKVSAEVNKKAPYQVDKMTILETTIPNGNTLIFKYKILGSDVNSLSENDINEFKEEMFVKAKNVNCSNNSINTLLEKGLSTKYIYSDDKGLHIATIDLSKNDCNKL